MAGPGSVSSGAPSSEGGESSASRDSLGVLGRDGDQEGVDLLSRGNKSSKVSGGQRPQSGGGGPVGDRSIGRPSCCHRSCRQLGEVGRHNIP